MQINSIKGLPDEDIVIRAQGGDNDCREYILNKYKSYAIVRARTYFLIGADREDVIQEGMIGLFKAMRDFDPKKDASFKSFAELCITRQIISAVKSATRKKHIPLNSYISFSHILSEDDDNNFYENILTSFDNDPQTIFLSKERMEDLNNLTKKELSRFELSVLNLYLMGISYQEISKKLDKPAKSIDNALQRIRRKLSKVFI